jgi:hypothetical protein
MPRSMVLLNKRNNLFSPPQKKEKQRTNGPKKKKKRRANGSGILSAQMVLFLYLLCRKDLVFSIMLSKRIRM